MNLTNETISISMAGDYIKVLIFVAHLQCDVSANNIFYSILYSEYLSTFAKHKKKTYLNLPV